MRGLDASETAAAGPKEKLAEVLEKLHDGISGGYLGVHRTLRWKARQEDLLDQPKYRW